jgi:hypothetical protein
MPDDLLELLNTASQPRDHPVASGMSSMITASPRALSPSGTADMTRSHVTRLTANPPHVQCSPRQIVLGLSPPHRFSAAAAVGPCFCRRLGPAGARRGSRPTRSAGSATGPAVLLCHLVAVAYAIALLICSLLAGGRVALVLAVKRSSLLCCRCGASFSFAGDRDTLVDPLNLLKEMGMAAVPGTWPVVNKSAVNE